jgi:hypothetical protein
MSHQVEYVIRGGHVCERLTTEIEIAAYFFQKKITALQCQLLRAKAQNDDAFGFAHKKGCWLP